MRIYAKLEHKDMELKIQQLLNENINLSNAEIARRVGCDRKTVAKKKNNPLKYASKYRGVYFFKRGKIRPWMASCKINKYIFLGHFRTQGEAAQAWNNYVRKTFGEDYYQNEINPEDFKQNQAIQYGPIKWKWGRRNYRGVRRALTAGKWTAITSYNSKHSSLGNFYSQEEAAAAYNKHVLERFGEFATINLIDRSQEMLQLEEKMLNEHKEELKELGIEICWKCGRENEGDQYKDLCLRCRKIEYEMDAKQRRKAKIFE